MTNVLKNSSERARRPAGVALWRMLAIVLVSVFLSEAIIMLGLSGRSIPVAQECMLDAGLLSVVVCILLYLFLVRPLSAERMRLRASEKRFHSLFDSSRDAIMTLEPPSWSFTSGNPACVEMFGAKDESDFTSHPPWELSPERQPDGSSSGEKAKEMIEIAMRDGSNFFEWTHRRITGEEFAASVLLTRMQIGGGSFLQATVRDTTEQKLTQEKLMQATEEWQNTFDAIDAQVAIINSDYKIVKANRFMREAFKGTEVIGAECFSRSRW